MIEKSSKDLPSIRRSDAGKRSEEPGASAERLVPNTSLVAELLEYIRQQHAMTPEERVTSEKNRQAEDERFAQTPNLELPAARDEKTLDKFFTPEVLRERVAFWPALPYDLLDF